MSSQQSLTRLNASHLEEKPTTALIEPRQKVLRRRPFFGDSYYDEETSPSPKYSTVANPTYLSTERITIVYVYY